MTSAVFVWPPVRTGRSSCARYSVSRSDIQAASGAAFAAHSFAALSGHVSSSLCSFSSHA